MGIFLKCIIKHCSHAENVHSTIHMHNCRLYVGILGYYLNKNYIFSYGTPMKLENHSQLLYTDDPKLQNYIYIEFCMVLYQYYCSAEYLLQTGMVVPPTASQLPDWCTGAASTD